MNKNIFNQYTSLDREALKEALENPVETEILKEAAWRALTHWMMSKNYKNRPTSYNDQVAPLIFPALFEPGWYGGAKSTLFRLWKHFGWIESSGSRKGWGSDGDRSESTEKTYLSMARSNNPEVRSRGDHLLNSPGGQKSFLMVQVNATPVIEHLRSIVTTQEFIGKPKKQIVEDLGIPLPLVKVIWGDLIDTENYQEKLEKIGSSRQRVLKVIQNRRSVKE